MAGRYVAIPGWMPQLGDFRVDTGQRLTGSAAPGRALRTAGAISCAIVGISSPDMSKVALPPYVALGPSDNIGRSQLAVLSRMPFLCYGRKQRRQTVGAADFLPRTVWTTCAFAGPVSYYRLPDMFSWFFRAFPPDLFQTARHYIFG